MYLTTSKLNPNRAIEVENFDRDLLAILPNDYKDFLLEFGTGKPSESSNSKELYFDDYEVKPYNDI